MALRIAPELYLKQLVVGGFDRVYEMGPQFRNESKTYKHNPEFWSLEYYMAYADYYDIMKMCEDMLSTLVKSVFNSYTFKYLPHGSAEELTVDFTPPFKRLNLVEEIEKAIGETIPTPYDSDDTRLFLIYVCNKFKIFCDEPKTTARLFDKLCGEFVESQCQQPTFITNHPAIMSPLAKLDRFNPYLTERFELFVNGFEICNAYTELNDPVYQRETFGKQMKDKVSGDQEAQNIDEIFINALEYGLPPTAGFGMGIDRFVMLLSNVNHINDVILFPTLRSDVMPKKTADVDKSFSNDILSIFM
jgi:lysyl-tRNA synthetase class 2